MSSDEAMATANMNRCSIGPGFRWRLLTGLLGIKLLLVPAYRSTDFEVHRNWLAITHSLPLRQWYTEATSEWTLDYAPLFAWFEWALSQAARLADPAMLMVDNLGYASDATIWFQRGTVMAADGVLWAAAAFAAAGKPPRQRDAVFALVVASAGLLLVDHIHFQYNGLLLGLLVWSISLADRQRDTAAAAVFAVLLNMKHLFAAAAPVYFVYLLRHGCRGQWALAQFCSLAAVVAAVCAVSFGPWIYMGQLRVVLARLFPFGRGLTHAYWAPNFWALYAATDRALAAALPRLGLRVKSQAAGLTGDLFWRLRGGLVGAAEFAVLPGVGPAATAALVLAAQLPALAALWRKPAPAAFCDAIVQALLSAFVFGFHVHEKAILTMLIPMVLGAARSRVAAADFLFLAAVGHQGLLPLLHEPREWPIKAMLAAVYFLAALGLLQRATGSDGVLTGSDANGRGDSSSSSRPHVTGTTPGQQQPHGDRTGRQAASGAQNADATVAGPLPWTTLERAYLCGLVPLELYCAFGHRVLCFALFGGHRLPFLPLLLTSVYCGVGVLAAWVKMTIPYVRQLRGSGGSDGGAHRHVE